MTALTFRSTSASRQHHREDRRKRPTSIVDQVHDYLTSSSMTYQNNILRFRQPIRELVDMVTVCKAGSLDIIVP